MEMLSEMLDRSIVKLQQEKDFLVSRCIWYMGAEDVNKKENCQENKNREICFEMDVAG